MDARLPRIFRNVRGSVTLLVVAAVGLVGALAIGDALRSGRSSSAAGTSPLTTTERPSISTEQEIFLPPTVARKQAIKRIGNRWAELFAAGGTQGSCFQMTQPACERINCVRVGGIEIRNCTLPTLAFRRSFLDATVEDIVVRQGWQAAVWFSNGEVVEFMGDGGTWRVRRLGEDVPRKFAELRDRQEIEWKGNAWARLFATGRPRHDGSCRYQTQPLCERNACVRVGGFKIRNCTPPTRAFRNSFLDATVEDIVIKGDRAAARFSNGELVEFSGGGGVWWVHKLGENAGRGFFE
jgi:hypothetical protein